MTNRENILRAIRFEQPECIPMSFHINSACWNHYDQNALQDLMEAHPLLFPNFKRQEKVTPQYAPNARSDEPYKDPWGCVWETTTDGIIGSVHAHPLADAKDIETYKAPDASETDGTYPVDWAATASGVARQKENGELITGGLPHGHTFLRMQDIRGYQELLFDMMDEEPHFFTLLDMVRKFNLDYVKRWLELKPDMMSYPEDLGMQVGPMVSPDLFQKFIKPVYQELMQPARAQGCIVHMHSDGDIRLLADDLIDGGVEVINLQDLVNGIDWIAEKFAGRVCIDLDIDRQTITAQGTPQDIDDLILDEVQKLGSKQGGLMMIYGLYPGVPLENVNAIMSAMEKYSTYYS